MAKAANMIGEGLTNEEAFKYYDWFHEILLVAHCSPLRSTLGLCIYILENLHGAFVHPHTSSHRFGAGY
jgi:hypothetical protein